MKEQVTRYPAVELDGRVIDDLSLSNILRYDSEIVVTTSFVKCEGHGSVDICPTRDCPVRRAEGRMRCKVKSRSSSMSGRPFATPSVPVTPFYRGATKGASRANRSRRSSASPIGHDWTLECSMRTTTLSVSSPKGAFGISCPLI